MISSIKGSLRASHSRRHRPVMKDSSMLSVKQSMIKSKSPIARNTIYLDENNNIVNPATRKMRSSKVSSNRDSQIPGVVFESNDDRQKGMWDSISNINDDFINNTMNPMNITQDRFGGRFKSPSNIIPENHTFDEGTRNLKNLGKRFKSTSPSNRMVGHRRYNFTSYKIRRKKVKCPKLNMRTKVSKLMETFQSVPIKILHREKVKQNEKVKVPNRINITLK